MESLFAWLKVPARLKIFDQLRSLTVAISLMVGDFARFTALLGIALVAFSTSEYVAYGYTSLASASITYTFISRLGFTFGGRELHADNTNNQVLGVILPALFLLAVGLLLMNLLIAVLSRSYERALSVGDAYWAEWQYEQVMKEGRNSLSVRTARWARSCGRHVRRRWHDVVQYAERVWWRITHPTFD